MPKIVISAVESIQPGKTLDDIRAAWAHVAEAAAKTPGVRRFQSSWDEESKTALVTEVLDSPEAYHAFFGNIDVAMVTASVKFEQITLQCAADQVAGFGDMVKNFGMKVYITDACAGHDEL